MSSILEILVVEDSDSDFRLLERVLQGLPVRLNRARTLREFKLMLLNSSPDAILLDLRLPDSDDMVATANTVVRIAGSVPVIALTGHEEEEFSVSSLKTGIQDLFVKGTFDGHTLVKTIRKSIERSRATKSNESMVAGQLSAVLQKSIDNKMGLIEAKLNEISADNIEKNQTKTRWDWVKTQLSQNWLALLTLIIPGVVYLVEFRDSWHQYLQLASEQQEFQEKDEKDLQEHIHNFEKFQEESRKRDLKLQILQVDTYDFLSRKIEDSLNKKPSSDSANSEEPETITNAREQNKKLKAEADLFESEGSVR